jgi:prephenate dehydrogenase
LGSSLTLAVSRCFPGVKTVGYSHRASTRRKARELAVASEVFEDLKSSVSQADIVVLATPIFTFEEILGQIAGVLSRGCVVTDVGSTKVLVHQWAAGMLAKGVHYVGSHPIAGSEQRGVEFARDDFFEGALCILTATKKSSRKTVRILKGFWSSLGCRVKVMAPDEHDRILGNVSHLPHVTAAALMNASKMEELKFASKGFMDTSRIASGPANIWADVLLSNAENVTAGTDRIIGELRRLRKAIAKGQRTEVESLLAAARDKRNAMISYKIAKKELIS